jgi:hypothetical protein
LQEEDKELYDVRQLRLARGAVLESFDHDQVAYQHLPGVLFINVLSVPKVDEVIFNCNNDFGALRGCLLVGENPELLNSEYRPIKDEEGRTLAYFRGDSDGGTLWLTFRPDQHTRRSCRVTVGYVMKTVSHWMHPELEEPPSHSEYAKIVERENFIALAAKRLDYEIDCISTRSEEALSAVQEARANLVRALRTASLLRLRANELTSREREELVHEVVEQLEKEFKQLEESVDIETISFDEERIRAITRPIKIRHDGIVYEMGRYEISVNDDTVRITSADGFSQHSPNRGREVCHPQIFSNGEACFGNADETIVKLQEQRAYSTLLPLFVLYLETGYNPADHELSIESFNVPTHPDPEGEEERVRAEQRTQRRAARRGRLAGQP